MENNSNNLEISRGFDCSKEKLYQAWNEPQQLKKWWKPLGKQLKDVTNNLAENGEVKYVFEDNMTIEGKYKKVEPGSLLEYSWNWHMNSDTIEDASYNLLVKFEGDEKASKLVITQTGFKNEDSVQPHRQGWEQGLQQLNDFIKQQSANYETSNEAGEEKPPITGYNETPEQLKVGGA